jgi:ABC-type Fe3+/spermidine/putrescine transport system ATPase subunit
VTHDQAEAMVLSDRIAVMQSGHLEQVGTPVALYERPASPFVRDFLGRVLTLEVCMASPESAEVPGEAGVTFQLPPGCSHVADGSSRLVLAWRPENTSIEPDSAPGLNRLSATVETAAYLGERIEYGVRTAGGRSMLVVSSRQQRYEPGALVGLRVDTSEATLWAGEEACSPDATS